MQAAFGLAAQYIVLAGMLQPGREVYRRSLGVVQPLLPLPYLRRGFLQASSPPGPSIEERCAPCMTGLCVGCRFQSGQRSWTQASQAATCSIRRLMSTNTVPTLSAHESCHQRCTGHQVLTW